MGAFLSKLSVMPDFVSSKSAKWQLMMIENQPEVEKGDSNLQLFCNLGVREGGARRSGLKDSAAF